MSNKSTTIASEKRFLKVLKGEPVDRPPFWFMRQAGRYLPEYRATRADAGDFLSLCYNSELAEEVTLQPIRRYGMDAAILFADILLLPQALGQHVAFKAGEGPVLDALSGSSAVARLQREGIHDTLAPIYDTVSRLSRSLPDDVALIGFAGAPWTVATYMVEGGSSKDFRKSKAMLYDNPQAMHLLLDKLAQSVTAYLNGQILAGAQAVQIFDSWGGSLSAAAYQEFSLAYMRKIVSGLIREHEGRKVPVILFTKGGGLWLESIADAGADALGLDWTCDIGEARRRVGGKVALQGNMDPSMLYAPPARIEQEVGDILAGFGEGSGHVFNLGHGIHLDVPPEHAGVFVEAVHRLSAQYHK